ncbi:Isoprene synthase [Quillaja saponaria]|uniref:Isoprene synthase n=1 Tax=Quillaja saponaria TaxID=32244 RepID=A0AAD7L2I5_QUISA|nr:Isoprene synthase [Quillaja saponaria]
MLSLYEASYFSVEGETTLDEARNFTSIHLKEFANKSKNNNISLLVKHALEFPLHWRPSRLEARWFINFYDQRKHNMNPILLELAKLDFNILQALYQKEIKHSSRWWKGTGLAENLSFVRDRLMESYIWHPEMSFAPQFGDFRRTSSKLYTLMTMLDDIYDIYGTLEELEILTDAFCRWDTSVMDKLPNCMKILFLAIHNYVNEVAYDILRDQGFNIIPCLKKYVRIIIYYTSMLAPA